MNENLNILSIIKQKMSKVKSFNEDHLIEYILYVYEFSKENSSNNTETHHIMPRCDFPEFSNLKKFPQNAAVMDCKDHFISHYLLYKAIPTKGIVYGFNQMKRVLKDSKDLFLGSLLYEEARIDINNNLRLINLGRKHTEDFAMNISKRMKNKVIVYDVLDKSKTLFHTDVTNEKYLSGQYVYYRTGLTHKKSTIEKISENGIRNRIAYTDENRNLKYFKDLENIPSNFSKGNHKQGPVCSERFKDLTFYYNPETHKQKRFKEGNQPMGWVKGKLYFGIGGNPRNNKKISYNFITNEKELISKYNEYPKFCANPQARLAYIFDGYVTFTPGKLSLINSNLTAKLVTTIAGRLLKEKISKIKINYVKEEYQNYLKNFDTYQEIGLEIYTIEDFLCLPDKDIFEWLG